ncbi:hypothetical protein [Streptomyces sp. NPDC007172]
MNASDEEGPTVAPDGTLFWKHVALLGAAFQSVDTLTRELARLQEG